MLMIKYNPLKKKTQLGLIEIGKALNEEEALKILYEIRFFTKEG